MTYCWVVADPFLGSMARSRSAANVAVRSGARRQQLDEGGGVWQLLEGTAAARNMLQ